MKSQNLLDKLPGKIIFANSSNIKSVKIGNYVVMMQSYYIIIVLFYSSITWGVSSRYPG